MDPSKMSSYYKCQISPSSFERFKHLNEGKFWSDKTYNDFVNWNNMCMNNRSRADQKWVVKLCDLILLDFIKVVDEEHCTEMTACSIYFNENGILCITNPR